MAKSIRTIKDKDGNIVYPQTHIRGVVDSNDVNLETTLAGKQDTINDLSTIRLGAAAGATAYQKPVSGIPKTDMASGVQTSLGKADSAYQKPSGGIPKSDLASGVQTSLDFADSSLQYTPSGAVDPTITPATYATNEQLDELEAKVDGGQYQFSGGTAGKYIKTNGSEATWQHGYISDYYPVLKGDSVQCYCASDSDALVISFYDSDKVFVNQNKVAGTGATSFGTYQSTAPVDGYVRFYTDKARISTAWTDSYFFLPRMVIFKEDVFGIYENLDDINKLCGVTDVNLTDINETLGTKKKIPGVNFTLNKYLNSSAVVLDGDGWAIIDSTPVVSGRTFVFKNGGGNNYGFWWVALFDENGNHLGNFSGNGVFNIVSADTLLSFKPLAKTAKFNVWDGTSSTALTPVSVSGWLFEIGYGGGLVEEFNGLANDVDEVLAVMGETKEIPGEDFVLNKYLNHSATVLDGDGWAIVDDFPIANGQTIVFDNGGGDGYGIWWVALFDGDGNHLGDYDVNPKPYMEVSTAALLAFRPLAKSAKINIYDGTSSAALTSADVANWKLEIKYNSGIIPELDLLSNTVEGIISEIGGKPNLFHCDLTPGQLSYIVSPFSPSKKLKTTFNISRPSALNDNTVFNYGSVFLVDNETEQETRVHYAIDEIAPANYNGIYIGGNHGDSDCRAITATNHGKTAADIGSTWNIGGAECVLVGVPDANTLWFFGPNTLVYPLFSFRTDIFTVGATLVHNSGATHTGNIIIEAVTNRQWLSATLSTVGVFIDGKQVTEDGDYRFNKLSICELYDVFNPASVIEQIKAGVGTFTETPNPNSFPSADKVVKHSLVYEFDDAARWKVAGNFIALQNISINYYGFMQQAVMEGDNISLYIPKSLPVYNGQETIDLRTIVSWNSVPSTINLTSQYWEDAQLPPDRWLQISPNIALHSGYLFDYGVGGEKRKDNVNNAFFLYTSRKVYPHGIDNKLTISAGDTFSAVMWRNYKDLSAINQNGLVCSDVFEYAGDCYIYADFNSAGLYELEIPAKFAGREIEVFEKRSNVELLTPLSNSKIVVKVTTGTPMYGYIVAKIKG